MSDSIANYFVELFRNKIPDELIISSFPSSVLELRGGLIAASLLKVDIIAGVHHLFHRQHLPIPFILLFICKIFQFLKTKGFSKMIEKLKISLCARAKKSNAGVTWFNDICRHTSSGNGGWTARSSP